MSLAVDAGSRTSGPATARATGGNHVQVTRWRVDRKWRTLSHRTDRPLRPPVDLRPPRRLPPAARARRRRPPRRHRRRRRRHQPARPRLARRQGAAVHRRTGAPMPDNPFADASSARALRLDLRPPQRPGPRAARRRVALVGRARQLPRRRGQPPRARRRLRLEPGPGLQRVGADDRPVAARRAAGGRRGPPATRRSRPPARPGSAARSGAGWRARSPSPRSRPPRCSSCASTDDGDPRLRRRDRAALQRFGRVRSITSARNGDLLVTTDNGSGDQVLRVSPALT